MLESIILFLVAVLLSVFLVPLFERGMEKVARYLSFLIYKMTSKHTSAQRIKTIISRIEFLFELGYITIGHGKISKRQKQKILREIERITTAEMGD